MNARQLCDELITLFVAGHETTANALTWASYLLSTHVAVAHELCLVLALLAQSYNLHLVPGRRVETVAMATLRPRYGMWMTAHPR